MSRQNTKDCKYYDNIEYHVKARDFASKMKFRRLSKIREVISRTDCVLELGCSSSVWSDDFKNWVGLDISKTALAVNKGKNVVQASALKLPFKETCFSLVTMFNLIEHLSSPEDALLEALRVMKPAGFLALGRPPLIWELLLFGETSNYRRKRLQLAYSKKLFVVQFIKRLIPWFKEFYNRFRDEIYLAFGKILSLNPVFLDPDLSKVGGDYDAIYAYDPNEVINFLRSRGLKVLDLKPFPIRIFRLPTSDVEIILIRKTGTKLGQLNQE